MNKQPRKWLTCEQCGGQFQCKRKSKEKTRRFCSRSCASVARHKANPSLTDHLRNKSERARRLSSQRMKKNNPMHDPKIREKAAAPRRGRPFPVSRGGNGAPLPKPQIILSNLLGWPTEYQVNTSIKEWPWIKIDIANPILRVAIECDGPSHESLKQQDRDRRKDNILRDMGWIVLRFTNHQILHNTKHILSVIRTTLAARISRE